jgi:glycosyltransferase involved in cell wall biosynthesis
MHQAGPVGDAAGVRGVRVPERLRSRPSIALATQVGRLHEPRALRRLRRSHPELVLHKTHYSRYLPAPDVPAVITVHDMTYERHPQTIDRAHEASALKRLWCDRAEAIITVSDYSKGELLHFFDVDPQRVFVCRLGVTRVSPDPRRRDALSGAGPFVLYVGQRRGYKNFDGLLAAFARSAAPGAGIRLVAFGGGPASEADRRAIAELGIERSVVFAGGDDAALAAHYASALALIHPSLDEGFGLPLLEAMSHGCPVAAARAGAMPEVAGPAALLFEPREPDSVAAAIDRLVSDDALRTSLSHDGRARAEGFSWEATARATLSAYEYARA